MNTLITYKIVADDSGRLKTAAKLACNFWNKYLVPRSSIVMRLGLFTSFGNTIARSYKPYSKDGVVYGVIEFNTQYLVSFVEDDCAGTIVHELGHTLGFGWDEWLALFDHDTGLFRQEAVDTLPDLASMRVETDYGPGTTLSHWDEETFGRELMTGFKDSAEYVLPVTIDVMKLLGHVVTEHLASRVPMADIMQELRLVQFSMLVAAESLDKDHFVQTEIWEEIYTERRRPFEPIP